MKVGKTKKEEKKQNSDLGIIVEILKRKGLVAFASLGLLVSIIIMGTTAWYTKINDVSGITLNVAQFDFKADFTTEEFMLNAANYFATENNLCAPGTVGVIPIVLTTSGDTAVTYSLGIDTSEMADEFKARIRFFYVDKESEKQVSLNEGDAISYTFNKDSGSPASGAPGSVTEYVYWEWVYELSEDKFYDYINKKWILTNPVTGEHYYETVKSDGTVENPTTSVTLSSLYVYNNIDEAGQPNYQKAYASTKAAVEAFNDFDYKVGTGVFDKEFTSSGPALDGGEYKKEEKYMSTSSITYDTDGHAVEYDQKNTTVSAVQFAMQSKIMITGAQANPSEETELILGTGRTKYKPISEIMSGVNNQ